MLKGLNLEREINCLEHSTLKVPYELFNKKFRSTQKVLHREAENVAQIGIELEKLLIFNSGVSSSIISHVHGISLYANIQTSRAIEANADNNQSNHCSLSSSSNVKAHQVAKLLGHIAQRLQSLKKKADEYIKEELEATDMITSRLEHLVTYPVKEISTDQSKDELRKGDDWRKARLNRMLVEHLLRNGLYDTANRFAETQGLKHLTNIEVFASARDVESSLRKKETGQIVAWCNENRTKLRKINSSLEFEIRVQEFVELVRKGDRLEAVKHAKTYLAETPENLYRMEAVKKCMGLLAFPVHLTESAIHPYYDLLCDKRWKRIIKQFRVDHARIYHLSSTSVLGTVIQAGLASLKTSNCYRDATKNPNCPVCSDNLKLLANVVPFAHCARSRVFCPISGEPMNENNPPVVLPSGFVYGSKALEEMARQNNRKVFCTRSRNYYFINQAERIFVM